MRNFRRFLSFLLAVTMVMSLLGISVFAAEGDTVIDTVELSGIPESIAVGDAVEVPAIAVPEGANYTICDAHWSVMEDSGDFVPASGTFEAKKYELVFWVDAKEGYIFTEQEALNMVAQLPEYADWWVSGTDVANDNIQLYVLARFDLRQEITALDLPVLPTAEVGKPYDLAAIKAPEGANYTLEASIWEYSGGSTTVTNLENKEYELDINAYGDATHKFSDEVTVTVAGQELEGNYFVADGTLYVDKYIDLRKEINTIELTGIPTAVEGKDADASSIKTAENAPYTVDAKWWNANTGEAVTGKFGKAWYNLGIYLYPVEGYKFADEVAVTLDGKSIEEYEDFSYDFWESDGWIDGYFDLRTPITKVELTNVPSAAAGQAVPKLEVKVPENANYTVEAAHWTDYINEEMPATFGAGEYRLYLELDPNEGYYFDNPVLYVNGQIIRDTNEEGWAFGFWSGNNYVQRTFNFGKPIETVAITGAPVAEAGKAADLSGLKVPEGANYEITWKNLYDYDTYEDAETFKAGHTYGMNMEFSAKEGYAFTPDTLFTLDGVAPEVIDLDLDGSSYAYVTYYFEIAGEKEETDKTIDKVEITGAPTMEKGKEADMSAVKIPEDANYDLQMSFVCDDDTGDDVNGPLEEGKRYAMIINIAAKPGYEFDEKTVVTINGKQTEEAYWSTGYIYYRSYVDFRQYVEQVDITGATGAEVDKAAVTTGVTAAAGQHVKSVDVQWEKWNYERGEYENFTGTFAAGNVYRRNIVVTMENGYAVDGVVTLNGEKVDEYFSNSFILQTEFSFVENMIQNVDLLITDPEIGKMFNEKNIQIAPEAHSYFSYRDWWEYVTENSYWSNVFDEDSMYQAQVMLHPESGYVYDPNVVITINGKNADIHVWNLTYIVLDLSAYFDTTEREEGAAAVRPEKILNALDEETGSAVIDMSGMASTTTKVELPVAALKELVEEKATLTIKTDAATAVIDATALAAIVKAAGDNPVISLEIVPVEKTALNEKQQAAIGSVNVAGVISAQILCNGQPISDFGGGTITVSVPFTPAEGTEGAHYAIWYVADDGAITKLATTFAENALTVAMPHFSDYIIAYAPPASNPNTGDTFPVALLSALVIVSAMGLAALAFTKKRSF